MVSSITLDPYSIIKSLMEASFTHLKIGRPPRLTELRDDDAQGRSHADEFGRLRAGPGGIGPKSTIQARHATAASLLQCSQVDVLRGVAVGSSYLVP